MAAAEHGVVVAQRVPAEEQRDAEQDPPDGRKSSPRSSCFEVHRARSLTGLSRRMRSLRADGVPRSSGPSRGSSRSSRIAAPASTLAASGAARPPVHGRQLRRERRRAGQLPRPFRAARRRGRPGAVPRTARARSTPSWSAPARCAIERYGRMLGRPERRASGAGSAGLTPEPLACTVTRSGEVAARHPAVRRARGRGSWSSPAPTLDTARRRGAGRRSSELDPDELTLHGRRCGDCATTSASEALLCEGGPARVRRAARTRDVVDQLFLTVAAERRRRRLRPPITSRPAAAGARRDDPGGGARARPDRCFCATPIRN